MKRKNLFMKRLPSRERLPSHLLQKSGSKQKPSLFGRSFMLNFSIVIILSILLGIIVLSVQMHSSMKRKEMEALASTLRTGVEQVDDQISNVTDSLLSLRDELSSSGKRFIGRYDANTLNDTRNRLQTIVSHNSLIEEIVHGPPVAAGIPRPFNLSRIFAIPKVVGETPSAGIPLQYHL